MKYATEAFGMTISPSTWHQMRFHAPEGRDELLWVEARGDSRYSVLSVPVWLYGISPGTIVEGREVEGQLTAIRILAISPGATIRFVVPSNGAASVVYLSRILADAKHMGIGIGPATFLNPRLCAFHLRQRADWWPRMGRYLDGLVAEGIVSEWEVGDPDEYGADAESTVAVDPVSELCHPLPVDGQEESYLS